MRRWETTGVEPVVSLFPRLLMDCEHSANDDFLLVNQFTFTSALHTIDWSGFVDRPPLVIID